jgi:hypothetical protein
MATAAANLLLAEDEFEAASPPSLPGPSRRSLVDHRGCSSLATMAVMHSPSPARLCACRRERELKAALGAARSDELGGRPLLPVRCRPWPPSWPPSLGATRPLRPPVCLCSSSPMPPARDAFCNALRRRWRWPP